MNLNLFPPLQLQHMTLVKIAVTLWNQDHEVKTLLAKFVLSTYYKNNRDNVQKIVDIVTEKVSRLSLPQLLKKKILNFIKPVGIEMLNWIIFHKDYLTEPEIITYLNQLYWKSGQCMIDRKRTAKMLIQDKNIDVGIRYELSYVYCFENDLPVLWYETQTHCDKPYENPEKMHNKPLLVYWCATRKQKAKGLNSLIEITGHVSNQLAFQNAVFNGSEIAAEYFFQKLTYEERRKCILVSAMHVANRQSHFDTKFNFCGCYFIKSYYTDILYFLLLQMDESQLTELFTKCCYHILNCFLNWPWHCFFIEVIQHTWPFLTERRFELLLKEIIYRIIGWYDGDYYQNLFREFWNQSPKSYRQFVIDKDIECSVLYNLVRIEDIESINLILKDASEERKDFILSQMKIDLS